MTYDLHQSSVKTLPLEDGSVQCVVTSPPYWGLRKYEGEQEEMWGGDPEHSHEWGEEVGRKRSSADSGSGISGSPRQGNDYDVSQGAFCDCGAWYGALGLEPTPELYVEHMVTIFREVRRVLRPDGTLWLNLGDSYAGSWGNQGRTPERGTQRPINGPMITPVLDGRYPSQQSNTGAVPPGLKPKDLVGIPWRVALALQADGWWLRSDIIWSKPNPMPESIKDRPTKAHEYVFLLTKSARYFYDQDAIREPMKASSIARMAQNDGHPKLQAARDRRGKGHISGRDTFRADQLVPEGGRNARTVWPIATQSYKGAHFATFPEALAERCILAGSSPQACVECGAPWARVVERSRATHEATEDLTMATGRAGMNRERPGPAETIVLAEPQPSLAARLAGAAEGREEEMRERFGSKWDHWTRSDASGARTPTAEDAEELRELLGIEIDFDGHVGGWQPTCEHEDGSGRSVVLDPFCGSGTTVQIAHHRGRHGVGVDISEEYLNLARLRIERPLRSDKKKR